MFKHGQRIEFHYPRSTHLRFWHPSDVAIRRVIVHSVRDLLAEPLSTKDFLRRPFLMRSRYLIKAYEPDYHRWRRFYAGSSQEYWSPGSLRVGIYLPGESKPCELLGRPFESTPDDRRRLLQAIREWSKHDLGDAQIGIFADDLKLIR